MLREAFNARTANRWVNYQLSFDVAQVFSGAKFTRTNMHLFHIVICCDGTDARVYIRPETPRGPR